ncbi:NINE protein [Marinicellulosiphila megalodicopiae]|uniref:NINE protein n=1 Tax=Marinicellulosiphila megalodicopiae TaxID=2724896 RepID=UPI003BB0A07E
MNTVPSNKSYGVAVCLSGIFGVVGVHHFYLGRYIEGIIDFSMFVLSMYFFYTGQIWLAVLFFLVDGIHTFVVTIMLLTGSIKDGDGKLVCYPGQKIKYNEEF